MVQSHPRVLLMSDYDGTLVPLAPRPDQARPSARLLRLLQHLSSKPGLHLAIISGRSVGDLCSLLPLPKAILAGTHGRILALPATDRTGARPQIKLGRPGPGREVWEHLVSLARRLSAGVAGVWLEDKGEAIALHYRQADTAQAYGLIESFKREIEPWLHAHDLELLQGRKVLEVRPRGVHKGLAVEYLSNLYPWALPVYLGDDLTDEDAFRALEGKGLTVLVGPERPSWAKFRLPSPVAVQKFLSLLSVPKLPYVYHTLFR
ncbi:MAG: trehalose-phosphatase [Moorellaceae bacterium]